MLATGGGELWVVWYGDTTGGPNPVDYNTFASRWNGSSWDPEMLVSHPDTIGYYWYQEFECALDVDDYGHPHVVWHTYADGCVFYRAFDGDSWGDFVPIVDTSDEIWGDFAQIALDDSGNRHVVFVGPGPTLASTDIYYSMSSDGENWIPPYQIHVDDTIDDIPQIACTSSDNIWVTWFREISLLNTHVCVSHFDGDSWTEPVILDNDSTEADHSPHVALDSLDHPWVIWSGGWGSIYTPFTIFYNMYTGIGIAENTDLPVIDNLHFLDLELKSNPFQGELRITCFFPDRSSQIGRISQMKLEVYSTSGSWIRTLYSGSYTSGATKFNWDGCNALGDRVANGVYLIRLTTPTNSLTKKVLKLR
jgi:hypothetical protein